MWMIEKGAESGEGSIIKEGESVSVWGDAGEFDRLAQWRVSTDAIYS